MMEGTRNYKSSNSDMLNDDKNIESTSSYASLIVVIKKKMIVFNFLQILEN